MSARVLSSVVALALWVGGVSAPTVGAPRALAVRPTQELALLLTAHSVVSAPGARPSGASIVRAARPITGEQTALPVIGSTTTAAGIKWLRVMLPGRPNEKKGWIEQRGTVLTSTSWQIVVRTLSRRVLAYRNGQLVRSFVAIVGKPSTPTPHGQFFVEENVLMLPGSPGAPFALALSARSNVLQEFEGGPGQIAIHGVMNLEGTLGTAVSHGCVRLANADIRWLALRITNGVPVTITS